MTSLCPRFSDDDPQAASVAEAVSPFAGGRGVFGIVGSVLRECFARCGGGVRLVCDLCIADLFEAAWWIVR